MTPPSAADLDEIEKRVSTAAMLALTFEDSDVVAARAFAGYATDVASLVAEVRRLRAPSVGG